MASSSASSVQKTFKYDVFLSFRGEDTRKTFVDHLYHALEQKGVCTYKDDEKIKKGERINDQLMRSIEESKLYIIVFSENYASSSWCLGELVKIMECQRLSEHTAYPVFYDVEPTEIRKQIGCVELAFARHEKEEAAGKWRDAMREAADLAGWELNNTADGYEAKFIQKIVKEISLELRYRDLRFNGKLVGMETRVKDVVSSLEMDIKNVRVIGIWGMGGGGKTTLARAVFDQISTEFEGSSFVENVREVSNNSSMGLKSLQKQVLSDVLIDQEIHVSGVFDGKNELKRRLRCRKVLVVLDDVDRIDQLEALAGEPNWFKSGSRVIITTRDKKVLLAHRVDFIFKVNLLSDEEAICLLSRNAFGKEIPIQGYEKLSKVVVHYANGLPLTLKVLGSHLCGESNDVWRDALERLKTIPWEETMKILEISYNGLDDDYKEIFLDIACILKGWEDYKAIRVLESCGFNAKIGLSVLEQKSLVSVHKYGNCRILGIHDHIEEMGKNIVRRMRPNEPHKHSRLWVKEEIQHILANDLGTEETRSIDLANLELHSSTIIKGLKKMKGLKLVNLSFLSKLRTFDLALTQQVKTLILRRCHNLVEVHMNGECPNLKFLDLSSNIHLRIIKLGRSPNLEVFLLEGSDALEELHMPVGRVNLKSLALNFLSKLRTANLWATLNLKKLLICECDDLVILRMPLELKSLSINTSGLITLDLAQIRNLEEIIIENCENLKELIMPLESLELKSLQLDGLNLRILDFTRAPKLKYLQLSHSQLRTLDLVGRLNLEKLILWECEDLLDLQLNTRCSLRFLRELKLCGSFPEVPNELHQFECLEKLTLSSKKIKHLPSSICMLKHLKVLSLLFCVRLEQLPEDLGALECLEMLLLRECTLLRDIPTSIGVMKHLKTFQLNFCILVKKLPEEVGNLECLKYLDIEGAGITYLPRSIFRMKGLCIHGSRSQLESYGFTSIEEGSKYFGSRCYI